MRRPWMTAAAAPTLALALALSACTAPAAVDDAPSTIRIGITPEMLLGSFDPTTAWMGPISARAVYEGFFAYSDAGIEKGFEPALATGYELSEDWRSLTLTLREGVTFVDGEPLSADGVKTFLEGMAATEGWGMKALWDEYSPTLTAEDETTLVLSSDQPMNLRARGFLQQLLTRNPIASPASLDDLEATATDPLGSGPYVIESFVPEVSISLVRNEDYWNPDAYPFDTMELTVFADDVAALNALSAGQIDAAKLPISLANQARSEGFTLTESAWGRNMSIYIADRNGESNPAFADPRVRQAMALAFDREAINESLNLGFGFVTSQPFIEGQPEFVPDGDTRYGYDPERAKELLAEAGYPDGFDLVIPSTSFIAINTWEPVVAQYLGDIGIRVTFDAIPDVGAFFTAAISSTDYPVLMYFEGPFTSLPVYVTFDAVFNPFKIQDPVVDGLWSTIQSGPDDAAAEAAAELGEYVVDQAILIPFSTPKHIWAAAPGFTVTHDDGYPHLSNFSYTG